MQTSLLRSGAICALPEGKLVVAVSARVINWIVSCQNQYDLMACVEEFTPSKAA
jgi:hypothetical protein